MENVSCDESVIFDVICGDFNFDNMSPCDKVASQNEIFSEYFDPPRLTQGFDQVCNTSQSLATTLALTFSGMGSWNRNETTDSQHSRNAK